MHFKTNKQYKIYIFAFKEFQKPLRKNRTKMIFSKIKFKYYYYADLTNPKIILIMLGILIVEAASLELISLGSRSRHY